MKSDPKPAVPNVDAVNVADRQWSETAEPGAVLVRLRVLGEFAEVHDDSDMDEFPLVRLQQVLPGLYLKRPMAYVKSMS